MAAQRLLRRLGRVSVKIQARNRLFPRGGSSRAVESPAGNEAMKVRVIPAIAASLVTAPASMHLGRPARRLPLYRALAAAAAVTAVFGVTSCARRPASPLS